MCIEEMDCKYKAHGQQRFITVDYLWNIDNPSRDKLGKENRKPEYQSAEADNGYSPENS